MPYSIGRPQLCIVLYRIDVTAYAEHVSTWHTERVLVDGYDVLVEQQSLGVAVDGPQIYGHEQLRREYRPQTHLHALLVVT